MAQTINWPVDLIPSTFSIKLRTNTKQFTSPFNKASQDAHFPGSSWQVTIGFDQLDDDEARELEAVLFSLDNGGRVRIPDFGRAATNRTGVLVFGNAQTGGSLVTQGWPPNVVNVLRKGEYLEVGDELKYVLEDVSSDAAGRATIKIAPWLRGSYASGQAVNVASPCGYFKIDETETGPDRSPGMVNKFQIKFRESFY
jgi:hypothetical protein